MIRTYAAGALILLLLGLGAVIWWQHRTIVARNATILSLKHDVQAAVAANADMLITLKAQETALNKWKGIAQAGTDAAELAAQAAMTAQKSRDQLAKTLHDLEAQDNTPSCGALLTTDLAKVCPAHAQAVRERAK